MAEKTYNIQDQLAHFEQACRDAGLKLTHQRLEIFRELAAAGDHPSAETIYKRLRHVLPTLSIDTVYRTLTTLEEHHLISRIHTVESHARFEAKIAPHHHAICRKCGRISDFRWNSFDTTHLPDEISDWGKIENKQVTLHGTCQQCAEEKKQA